MIALYTRPSKEDLSSNSIANQLREDEAFADGKQFKHYNDGEGVSGGEKIEQRSELDKLVNDIYS